MKYFNKLLIIFLVLGMVSCSDLEPGFEDVIPEDEYFANEAAFISALGSAYTNLYGFMNHGNIFSLDAVSSDETAITHKGPDWLDGGQWLRTHRHEFVANEGVVNNVWNFCYGGINTCNRLIATFESAGGEDAAAFISELKVLRAYYHLIVLDVFGQAPIVDTFDVPDGFKPSSVTRQELYDWVLNELTVNVPALPQENSRSTYGRVNYYAGQAMLMSLYLNAEVYTGTAQWEECIAACDEIINSTAFAMEGDFFSNFAVMNDESTETIWAIPYDNVNAGGFNLVQMTLHYESQKTFKLVDQPWNGYCILADFYNAFEDDDIRKTGGGRGYGIALEGPQYDINGNLLTDEADAWYPDHAFEGNERAVVFDAEINELEPNAFRDGGTRIAKWEYEVGTVNTMSNDFQLYRYTEVLLNKAECMWRMNPGSTEALDLVNMVRARAGVSDFASLDADNFLAERGRELCFEVKRRPDLIRFDRWNDAWWEKPASEAFKKVMPIPADQIALNSNLKQNDGY